MTRGAVPNIPNPPPVPPEREVAANRHGVPYCPDVSKRPIGCSAPISGERICITCRGHKDKVYCATALCGGTLSGWTPIP